MSTSLLFFVPFGMLAIVWSLCFVGCPDAVLAPYSNDILTEPNLIAYWPLSDLRGPTTPLAGPLQGSFGVGTATDLSGMGHPGTYTIPPAYQMGATIPQIAIPTAQAGTAQSGLNLQQASIVPGDAVTTGSKNLPACVDFEGGYVNIPWAANSPSLADFTLEVWIKSKWTAKNFNWVVFGGITTTTGFAVYINTDNNWELSIGNGAGLTPIDTKVSAAVGGAQPTYVAVTFNSATNVLSLWINPSSDTSVPPTAAWPPDQNTTTTYEPIDRTQPMTFFIGAGATQLPFRTAAMGDGSPEAPFQGLIQSVALYSQALDPTDLQSHFEIGAASS